MRRVAVFGNAGAGKSALARQLAELTGLPLYPIDMVQFPRGYRPEEADGGKISREQYQKFHAALLTQDCWIVDGFDSVASAWARFAAADTLVYIDLPLVTHYAWVTKRLVKGFFRNPPGWPANSPLWESSLSSYRVIWRCHRGLTPKYRQLVAEASASKRVYHLKSPAQISAFLQTVEQELRRQLI